MMSAANDPYYVAKEDVQGAIREAQKMHKEWKRLLETENTAKSQPFQDLHANLAGELRQLDYDLQDITATISMVEENRDKFQISDTELANRKDFIKVSRAAVRDVQEEVTGRKALTKIENDKRSLLQNQASVTRAAEDQRRAVNQENEAFLARERQTQMQLVANQDDQLAELGKNAQKLGEIAKHVNRELQEQQNMLEELDVDIEKETEKLNFVMKRIGRLMKTSDNKQIWVIVVLCILFVVLLFLVINT
eukprot:TRINITY_DN21468_c0_g1_i1.p1 TRINITY_DN21468_c0_g1~~TRINITY_DN21468_c0_g1_i1.p1  ORF type:complete len:250 (-),score=62.78 TRINITY_DN21468_c0_g1_i1:117-866(-)